MCEVIGVSVGIVGEGVMFHVRRTVRRERETERHRAQHADEVLDLASSHGATPDVLVRRFVHGHVKRGGDRGVQHQPQPQRDRAVQTECEHSHPRAREEQEGHDHPPLHTTPVLRGDGVLGLDRGPAIALLGFAHIFEQVVVEQFWIRVVNGHCWMLTPNETDVNELGEYLLRNRRAKSCSKKHARTLDRNELSERRNQPLSPRSTLRSSQAHLSTMALECNLAG